MGELSRKLRLTLEAPDVPGIIEQVAPDHFEDYIALKKEMFALVDCPHASNAKQLQDAITGMIGQFWRNNVSPRRISRL